MMSADHPDARREGDLTLTRTKRLATIILGLASPRPYRNAAQAGTIMSGTAAVGSYCAVIHDLGNVADPVTPILTVTHP